MLFKDMKYERPEYEQVKKEYTAYLEQLRNAENKEQFLTVFFELEKLRSSLATMSTLCSIRHSINTRDEFYDKENDYWDEYGPLYSVFDAELSKICVACPFKEELYEEIPETFFELAECQIRSFDEKIVPLLQQENKLTSEYGKLKASAQIPYDGKIYNLSTIRPLTLSLDRKVRKAANDAMLKFYSDNESEFDRIYDELVKLRDKIAHELGYPSFTELAYQRMTRLDYNAEMVANYRKQILEDLVPAATRLYERQAKRLGVKTIAYYDEALEFLNGNPTPKGSYEELIEAARKMYHEMSPETAEFIDTMIEGDLWDLKSRDGKEMGGYCTSIPDYHVPFIFANFNGTSGDVDVLTHEAGHAFQFYMSRNIKVSDLQWPTMESAEIDSMSMEFNAWPWMNLFFKEDEAKYKYLHLGGAVKFLPYGVLVDHFQHEIYANPTWSPDERKACWRRLEKLYLPYKDYSESEILEKGTWWYRQGHIFESPFYYIDYTLAQVCALQFWVRNYNKDPEAWHDYVRLCKAGGKKSFTQLVKTANLKVPFEDGCVKSIVKDITDYMEAIDDTAL
ncbi:MAG: M3 family oligoendopeptidase [Erysipelotrichaceae bacterium]|nr:M3 family oligoendopeptidase [Erysipelotrichaceae bacterium]